MLKILVLICPLSVAPAQCDRTNAIDVIRSLSVPTPQQCGFMGQTMLAPSAIVPDLAKAYEKIVCVRDPVRAPAR